MKEAAETPGAFGVFILACMVWGFAVGVLAVAIVARVVGA